MKFFKKLFLPKEVPFKRFVDKEGEDELLEYSPPEASSVREFLKDDDYPDRDRFHIRYDSLGNGIFEVKPPEMWRRPADIWWPGDDNDFHEWIEEEAPFNTKDFERVFEWINIEERRLQPFETNDVIEEDCFFEEAEEDPEVKLSGGEEMDDLKKQQTCEWATKMANKKHPVKHYGMKRFAKEWELYENYEAIVPDDFERFGRFTSSDLEAMQLLSDRDSMLGCGFERKPYSINLTDDVLKD